MKGFPRVKDLENYDKYIANVLGLDNKRDLALLKFKNPERIKFEYLQLGQGHNIEIGDEVFCNWASRGVMWTPTADYVSRVRKNYSWEYDTHQLTAKVIQTQVPINPGNSGGPMFNKNGQVIGINAFGVEESQGLNFAVTLMRF